MKRKEWYVALVAGFLIGMIAFIVWINLSSPTAVKTTVHAQENTSITPALSPIPSGGAFQQSSSFAPDSSNAPSPTPERTNPFNYTPLPIDRGGPENDIVEVSPLTPSRTIAQVDDSITFAVTIKNQAPYKKHLWNFCFESTDGNFGCIFSIDLDPGQTYTFQNVGAWVHGGSKDVWVTWSQDNVNYYTPLHANSVQVKILG